MYVALIIIIGLTVILSKTFFGNSSLEAQEEQVPTRANTMSFIVCVMQLYTR